MMRKHGDDIQAYETPLIRVIEFYYRAPLVQSDDPADDPAEEDIY